MKDAYLPPSLRRSDRQIADRAAIEEMLRHAEAGRLGLSADNRPYVVPLNFVYWNDAIYFHCAAEGRKIDIIKENPRVCFEVDAFYGTVHSNRPAAHAAHYSSVIVFGRAALVEDLQLKFDVLQALLDKYAPGRQYQPLRMSEADHVAIVQIMADSMTGKARAPFYPGSRVRIRQDIASADRLDHSVCEVESVEADGRVCLRGSDVRLPWDRFELYLED
jgi:uncharacterized protein